MNKLLMILVLMGFVVLAHGQEAKKIYKYTDENGVTHYTETKPSEDYEEADLPKLSIIPSNPVKNTTTTRSRSDVEDVDEAEVQKFELIAPVKEQNLWGTGGKLTAQVSDLTPAQSEMYQVQFIINGKKQKPADKTIQVFENIYRGEHKVQGLLVNRYNQKVIKQTDEVTFFMHQNSKK